MRIARLLTCRVTPASRSSLWTKTQHHYHRNGKKFVQGCGILWVVSAGRAQLVDVTSVNATVVGSGTNSRVLREVGVASVEPASISLTAYSTGISVSQNDRGDTRMLNVTGNGWFYSGSAILMDYNLTANVGGFVTISMEFQFTGG